MCGRRWPPDITSTRLTDAAPRPLYQRQKGHTECIRELLEAGADRDHKRVDGSTAVWIASHEGKADALKLLIEAGADVNEPLNDGRTPICIACWNAHAECVRLLIAAGADMEKATKRGTTPLGVCRRYEHAECEQLLLAAGANPVVPPPIPAPVQRVDKLEEGNQWIHVEVPPDFTTGMFFKLQLPDKSMIRIEVPEDKNPGDSFRVQAPKKAFDSW